MNVLLEPRRADGHVHFQGIVCKDTGDRLVAFAKTEDWPRLRGAEAHEVLDPPGKSSKKVW